MKKKNRFKSWLIKVLRKWLSKLEPGYNAVNVTYMTVPCATVEASVAVADDGPWMRDYTNEVLAKKLGEEVLRYADIQWCDKHNGPLRCDRIYRATVRVAAERRG